MKKNKTNREIMFLSVDIGTSSVKAAVFDASGREIATSMKMYAPESPKPGWLEVAPEIYWQKTKEAVSETIDGIPCPSSIKAVGVTGQGETLVTLDGEGRPTGKAIVWLDTRAQEEAREIESLFGMEKIYRTTGQAEVSAGYTASIILWLKKNEPDRFRLTEKFLLLNDYIVYRLTGSYAANKALYPSTLYYDFEKEAWWGDMLSFLGIDDRKLPRLMDSGMPAGHVSATETGLALDTPVCPAPIDQVTGALGVGNIEQGTLSESTGTVLALCAVTDIPPFDREMRFGFFPHAVKGKYLAMPWAPASGSILSWFRKELCGGMPYEQLIEEAAGVAPGSEGLTVLPHFEGTNCPEKIPSARGVFWGLNLRHQRKHFARAIMESVAYLLRDYISILESCGIKAGRIISLGGAARSSLWSRIKADVTARDIVTSMSSATVCLGAAMVAAAGAGIFANCEEASKMMSREGRTFVPDDGAVKEYEKLYGIYRKLSAVSKNFYREENDG